MQTIDFHFVTDSKGIIFNNESYIICLKQGIASKEELLKEYNTKFRFPYFGFNWDALEDCLRDLDWIPQKEVIVYHPVLPKIEIEGLKTYLEILKDITKHWAQYEEHSFNAYFNCDDYDAIYKIMKHI